MYRKRATAYSKADPDHKRCHSVLSNYFAANIVAGCGDPVKPFSTGFDAIVAKTLPRFYAALVFNHGQAFFFTRGSGEIADRSLRRFPSV